MQDNFNIKNFNNLNIQIVYTIIYVFYIESNRDQNFKFI